MCRILASSCARPAGRSPRLSTEQCSYQGVYQTVLSRELTARRTMNQITPVYAHFVTCSCFASPRDKNFEEVRT